MLKTLGYLVSTLSVILLGLVSWKGAETEPALRLALLVGMVTSMVGMLLRWLAYRQEQREKAAAQPDLTRTRAWARRPSESTTVTR